jgi:hypothetical protein
MASSTTATRAEKTETHAERGTDESRTEILPETASLTIPVSADDAEVAAIVAAVGAHLRDSTEQTTADSESCNLWKLSRRLGGRGPFREVARGDEWKAAARSQ